MEERELLNRITKVIELTTVQDYGQPETRYRLIREKLDELRMDILKGPEVIGRRFSI